MLRQAQHERLKRSRGRGDRSRQGFRRDARGRRRQPRGAGRLDLRPARPQRRRQDDDPAHAPRHHRPVERDAAACSATSARSRRRSEVGYLPEERGLYPAMHAREAIAFMGALRGLPLAEGRRRADELLDEHGLGDWAKKPIRTLSKGMAQTVQLLGTIVHEPRLIVLDEPFSGLDAINQGRLEELIRSEARARRDRSSSRPMSSPMPSGCASGSRSSPRARSRSTAGSTRRARGFGRSSGCAPARDDGPWRSAIPGKRPARRRRMGVRASRRRPRAAAQGADRRRRGHRDAGDRAARACTTRSSPSPATPPRRRWATEQGAMMPPAPLRLRHRPPRLRARRCCRRPSSSSCSGRCSRCCSAACSAASAPASRRRRERPVVAVVCQPQRLRAARRRRDDRLAAAADEGSLVKLVHYAPQRDARRPASSACCDRSDPPIRAVLTGGLADPHLTGAFARRRRARSASSSCSSRGARELAIGSDARSWR